MVAEKTENFRELLFLLHQKKRQQKANKASMTYHTMPCSRLIYSINSWCIPHWPHQWAIFWWSTYSNM